MSKKLNTEKMCNMCRALNVLKWCSIVLCGIMLAFYANDVTQYLIQFNK